LTNPISDGYFVIWSPKILELYNACVFV
jgi:hypothetical protein